MLWAIACIDKPGMTSLRNDNMKVHGGYLDVKEANIFFSPLQTDYATESLGSLFILNVKTRAAAQAFIDFELARC